MFRGRGKGPRRDSGPRESYWPFEVAKWGRTAVVAPSFKLLTSLRASLADGGTKNAAESGRQHG